MKRLWRRYALLVGMALFVVMIIGGLIWNMVEIERCYDEGGVVVGPLMRGQECIEPETDEKGG